LWDRLSIPLDAVFASWTRARFAKVVLSVEDEPALVAVYEAALARGLPAAMITDAGRTEFHGVPTRTTVAVGPARAADIDPVTGPGGVVPTKLA
jgi:PTH2 family peptidyl-tRNA hydrolase